MVIGVLPLQDIPLVIGELAEEGMLGTLPVGRGGQLLNQGHDALPVGLEVAWGAQEQLRCRGKVFGEWKNVEHQVLERKVLECPLVHRRNIEVAQRHGERVGEVTEEALGVELAPSGLGVGGELMEPLDHAVAVGWIAEGGHVCFPFALDGTRLTDGLARII